MSGSKTERESALGEWARQRLAVAHDVPPAFALRSASDDASFRRYFRGELDEHRFIFVDAPPALEDNPSFVAIAGMLRAAGVNAPEVLAHDFDLGFMMLTDFGDELYENALFSQPESTVLGLYDDAVDALLCMQQIDAPSLPAYDEARLRAEMALFTEWFLPQQLGLDISEREAALIADVETQLVASALEQPRVFVHRDFHCRNLMIVADNNPGVIDFQDAVIGPVTYDLVSLLRDCYYRFDDTFIDRYVERLRESWPAVEPARWRRWFDLMGLQRHLKVAGIFSRLNLRDGKPRYLADIPLVIDYLVDVSRTYAELAPFARWLDERVRPRLAAPEFRKPSA